MRSQHVDRFNHDEDADGYDVDVLNSADPIRTGYPLVLEWVAARTPTHDGCQLLELGSGTGNLTLELARRMSGEGRVVAVDISRAMTDLARRKLEALESSGQHPGLRAVTVEWCSQDLLEFCVDRAASRTPERRFDAAVSTYAIHHLMPDERDALFGALARLVRPGGRFLVGDLMFENLLAEKEILAGYRGDGRAALADEVCEEFFWQVELDQIALEEHGWTAHFERLSELSWCLNAELREKTSP